MVEVGGSGEHLFPLLFVVHDCRPDGFELSRGSLGLECGLLTKVGKLFFEATRRKKLSAEVKQIRGEDFYSNHFADMNHTDEERTEITS